MNKGIYFAVFTALLWGFLAIAVKLGVNVLPPVTVSWFRFAFAFSSLSLFYLFFDRKKLAILKRPPKYALISGAALGCNYLGFIWGIHYTSPSIGQIFIQTGPVLLAIAGFVFFKEKVSIRQGVGLFLVVTGLLVFYFEQIINIAGGLSNYKIGVLLTLFGAFSWSIYAIFQKMSVQKHEPMQLNLIIFGLPTLAYIPFVKFNLLVDINTNNWLIMIFLGLNTIGAYGSLAYALKYLETNKISAIVTANPLITFVIMAILSKKQVDWIDGEVFSPVTILGALVVLLGVILTVIKKKKL